MKKFLLILMMIAMSVSSTVLFAGYTTYSANNGYTQPHHGYVPYYHSNLDYDYEYNYSDDDEYNYSDDDEYNYSDDDYYSDNNYYSDNDTYDIRYSQYNHRVDNSITHSDRYNIYAEDVDIDNNHYYDNYSPRWRGGSYPLTNVLANIPAPDRCHTKRYDARNDNYFGSIGLRIPESLDTIQKYRIRRSNGDRSRRYVPGDDVDTSGRYHNKRMWRHFGHYEHEIRICDHAISRSYQQERNYYYEQDDGRYAHPGYTQGYEQRYWDIVADGDVYNTNKLRSNTQHANRSASQRSVYRYPTTE